MPNHPDFPFSTDLTRYYFKQLVEAVEYLHSQNLVHRDLKMENLLMDENFNLKINDFGFQKTTQQQIGEKIICTTQIGTEAYQAPETRSRKEIVIYDGKKVDIFNIGVILFSMVLRANPL